MNVIEIWLPVVGYGGLYEVSNRGRVKSLARAVIMKDGKRRPIRERILKPSPNADGYPHVSLCRLGKMSTRKVHQLVAGAFIGERPAGQQVRHLDGIRTNRVVTNLEYGTPKQNGQDKILHGRSTRGEKHPMVMLPRDDVLDIRSAYGRGVSQCTLAAQYGVTKSTIGRITRRETWGWLQNEELSR